MVELVLSFRLISLKRSQNVTQRFLVSEQRQLCWSPGIPAKMPHCELPEWYSIYVSSSVWHIERTQIRISE